jgi:hypothetical protein
LRYRVGVDPISFGAQFAADQPSMNALASSLILKLGARLATVADMLMRLRLRLKADGIKRLHDILLASLRYLDAGGREHRAELKITSPKPDHLPRARLGSASHSNR